MLLHFKIVIFFFFFFQAEDGIRDVAVTGVQTCALPIWAAVRVKWCGKSAPLRRRRRRHGKPHAEQDQIGKRYAGCPSRLRSEERRVGKECRSRWWAYQ